MTAAALASELQARGVLPTVAEDVAFDVLEETDGFRRWHRVLTRTRIDAVEAMRLLERAGLFPTHKDERVIKW